MTTSPAWREVEQQLDHLTSELLRLQQQQTPWLMTPVEESDLLFLLEHAYKAISADMEPEEEGEA